MKVFPGAQNLALFAGIGQGIFARHGLDEIVSPILLEVLACPEDKGPLYYLADEDALYNPRLKRRYHVRDGIPIMLIDEAEQVSDEENERIMAKVAADGLKPTFTA